MEGVIGRNSECSAEVASLDAQTCQKQSYHTKQKRNCNAHRGGMFEMNIRENEERSNQEAEHKPSDQEPRIHGELKLNWFAIAARSIPIRSPHHEKNQNENCSETGVGTCIEQNCGSGEHMHRQLNYSGANVRNTLRPSELMARG